MTLPLFPECRRQARRVRGLMLLLLGLLGAVLHSPARADANLSLAEEKVISLTGNAEFWEAAPNSSLNDAQQAEYRLLTSTQVNQGISEQAFWIRSRLVNDSDQVVNWVLVHKTSYLDHLTLYYRPDGQRRFQQVTLTDRAPFHTRPLDYRALASPLSVPPNSELELYIKAWYEEPDSLSLQFQLYEQQQFRAMQTRESMVFGAYYGAFGVVIVIALIVGSLLHRFSVFSYAALLLATAFKWLMLNGYGFQYLWPATPYWHNEGFHIAFLTFAFFAFEFSKHFLGTARRLPWGHKLLLALQVLCILGLGFRLLGWYGPVLHLAFGLLTVVALVLPTLSAIAWWQGLTYARWYLLAWLIYSASLLWALSSAYWNIVPWGMQSLTILQLGSVLEMVFLTIALTERMLNLETERRQAVTLAQQDPLTGLGNRRLLQLEYERFRHHHNEERKSLFLIMIDLDHFKQINDRYGHDAGDKVLQEVARLLRQHCRETDVCIRYGGEEFALLLKADSMETALLVAERIREGFANRPTVYRGQPILHTLSCGITPVQRNGELMSVTDMMRYADQALYEGKAAGRNCTVLAKDGGWTLPGAPTPSFGS